MSGYFAVFIIVRLSYLIWGPHYVAFEILICSLCFSFGEKRNELPLCSVDGSCVCGIYLPSMSQSFGDLSIILFILRVIQCGVFVMVYWTVMSHMYVFYIKFYLLKNLGHIVVHNQWLERDNEEEGYETVYPWNIKFFFFSTSEVFGLLVKLLRCFYLRTFNVFWNHEVLHNAYV